MARSKHSVTLQVFAKTCLMSFTLNLSFEIISTALLQMTASGGRSMMTEEVNTNHIINQCQFSALSLLAVNDSSPLVSFIHRAVCLVHLRSLCAFCFHDSIR